MKTSIKKKSTFKKVLTGLALTGSLVGLPGISAANPAKYVSDSLAKMNTCGFTKPSDMYSACLALQHPDRIGDYDRWNIRGSICAKSPSRWVEQLCSTQRPITPRRIRLLTPIVTTQHGMWPVA